MYPDPINDPPIFRLEAPVTFDFRKLYSTKCNRKAPYWRMLDDLEICKYGDVIWSNASTYISPAGATHHIASLIFGSGATYMLSPGVCGEGVRACDALPHLAKLFEKSIAKCIAEGEVIHKRTYSIWRKKIILEKRDWQAEPLPLP